MCADNFFIKKVYLLYPCLALMSHNHDLSIFVTTIPNSSQLSSVVSNDYTTTTLYNVAKKAKTSSSLESENIIKVRH